MNGSASPRTRVLFVCVGNSCRSQMAEGFARAYGSDVIEPASAGLAPATDISPLTRQVMLEKNIRLDGQYPKGLDAIDFSQLDLIVNLSGYPLPPGIPVPVIEWAVPDPIGGDIDEHRQVCQMIENLVMQLILRLRVQRHPGRRNPAAY